MKITDTVLAFKLLDGSGLSEQQRQMALRGLEGQQISKSVNPLYCL